MKKGISALLVLLLLIFVSCTDRSDNTKAPEWMRGRTWSGEVTKTTPISGSVSSQTKILSFKIDSDGNLTTEDMPKTGVVFLRNGDTYTFEYNHSESDDGVLITVTMSFKFEKADATTCTLTGTVTEARSDIETTTAEYNGTLKAI